MSTSSNTLPIAITTLPALSEDSLAAYLNRVYSIPLLTQEEEYELASRLQADGDLQAAQRLVLSHLRYVVRVARDYKGYGLPLADLIQEGSVGSKPVPAAADVECAWSTQARN